MIPPPPIIPERYVYANVNDAQELKKFIRELEVAAQDSQASGGVYTAFLRLKSGQRLAVEIGFPITTK